MSVTNALTRHLANPHLFERLDRHQAVNKQASGKTFSVFNPSTGEVLAELPDMGRLETADAIGNARLAQGAWASRTARFRSDQLMEWHALIKRHAEDLAAILTAEVGKPLSEARSEIAHAGAYVRWYAEEANRIYGETIPSPSLDRRTIVTREPVGVVGAITPWNFPASMVARKIAPALAAGCTVVLKPAEQTPLVAGALVALAEQAGFPKGVINLVYAAEGSQVGLELCTNIHVRKISFTGSTEVGRLLMRQCANQIKRLSLELGGHAPFVVFADADLDAAVDGAVQAKFRNAGQTCVAANRIYVHAKIHDEFVERFVLACRHLAVGDGFDPQTSIGPLIDELACAKVEAQVDDAVKKGAILHCGGKRLGENRLFFEPTVLTCVRPEMKVLEEETFGPVAPILSFDNTQDVIDRANDTIHGLAAYFYTADIRNVWHVSEALQYGMIGVNTGRMSSEAAPFGGIKQSGFGREGSRHGIEEFLDIKYLCIGGL